MAEAREDEGTARGPEIDGVVPRVDGLRPIDAGLHAGDAVVTSHAEHEHDVAVLADRRIGKDRLQIVAKQRDARAEHRRNAARAWKPLRRSVVSSATAATFGHTDSHMRAARLPHWGLPDPGPADVVRVTVPPGGV